MQSCDKSNSQLKSEAQGISPASILCALGTGGKVAALKKVTVIDTTGITARLGS